MQWYSVGKCTLLRGKCCYVLYLRLISFRLLNNSSVIIILLSAYLFFDFFRAFRTVAKHKTMIT